MRVLVTGAEGMLGKDVWRVFSAAGLEALGASRSICDITNEVSVAKAVEEFRPNLIVNCAAMPDVDECERNPDRAKAVNETGPGILARAAERRDARLFHIGTDYVFDGEKGSPYVESDRTNPLNAYGRSKVGGELEALSGDGASRHLVIRTSWLFGFGKANFVERVLRDIAAGVALNAVSDQNSCPTWTLQLAGKILELARTDIAGIVHLAGSGYCSRQEMAAHIAARSGSSARVAGIKRADLNLAAKRPKFSAIVSERLAKFNVAPLPDWRDAIDEYLSVRKNGAPAVA